MRTAGSQPVSSRNCGSRRHHGTRHLSAHSARETHLPERETGTLLRPGWPHRHTPHGAHSSRSSEGTRAARATSAAAPPPRSRTSPDGRVSMSRAALAAVALLLLCAAAGAVRERDEEQVRFLRDAGDDTPRSFAFAAAEMENDCPPEPTVGGQARTTWPELLGKTEEEARQVLAQQAPGFAVQVLGPDMMATMEFRCNRIRLWMNGEGKVAQVPRIG